MPQQVCLIRSGAPGLLLTVALAFGVAVAGGSGGQQPDAPPENWRSHRLLWRAPVSLADPPEARVLDFQVRDDRIYYVGRSEVGCLSLATGEPLWQQALDARAQAVPGIRLELAISAELVLVSAAADLREAVPGPSRVLAFAPATGELLWQRELPRQLVGPAAFAGGRVLFGTQDGFVVALDAADGRLAWEREWAGARRAPREPPGLEVRGEDEYGVVLVAPNLLAGFRVADGTPLWRLPAARPFGQETDASGLALAGGVAYAFLALNEVVAAEVSTGRRLWLRHSTVPRGFQPEVALKEETLLVDRLSGDMLVAVEPRSGATAWVNWRGGHVRLAQQTGAELLALTWGLPRLGGEPRQLLSVDRVGIVSARDVRSGEERWRWQPQEGMVIRQVAAAGERLILTDGSALFAYGPGEPEPLPAAPALRAALAEGAVARLFGPEPWRIEPAAGASRSRSEENGDRLLLLRLGADGAPALLERVRAWAEREEGRPPTPEALAERRETPGRPFGEPGCALDLLVDGGTRDAVPVLLELASGTDNPFTRDRLTGALIRYGDRRAGEFLFAYARQADAEPFLQRSALHFACRAGEAPGLTQAEVTRYLLAAFQDPSSPPWLRRFANFELLNDRGEAARAAALATFWEQRRAPLLPAPDEPLPDGWVRPDAPRVRDEHGTWWAASTRGFLAPEGRHLWLVQSPDGQTWFRPGFVTTLTEPDARWLPQALRYRDGALEIEVGASSWHAGPRQDLRRTITAASDEVYRDTDGDGLPDRLERLLGTDPENPDTNGNGILDGQDKNPTAPPRPRTDEEAIYQAVLGALLHLERSGEAADGAFAALDALPRVTRGRNQPLLLPLPPGSRGIALPGYPGPVLPRLEPLYRPQLHDGIGFGRGMFEPPLSGAEGLRGPYFRSPGAPRPPLDPFTPEAANPPRQVVAFRDFFPYQLSEDGTRARVAWAETYQGARRPVSHRFEVEVRRIGDRWYPVECHQISYAAGYTPFGLTLPVRPLR